MSTKNLVNLFELLLVCVVLSGCGLLESSDIEYIPAKESDNDRWGLINAKGEFLCADEFDNVPSIVTEGVFSVREKDDSYTVYKADKKPKVLGNCEGLKAAGQMKEGLMPIVRPNERITVINKSGETVFELNPYKNHEIVAAYGNYKEGMMAVRTDEGKWGYVDVDGKMQIEPVYDVVTVFKDGFAAVSTETDGKFYIINQKGEKVFSSKEGMEIINFSEGYITIKQNDRLRILDHEGKEILKCPEKVEGIYDINDNYFVFRSNGNYGVMDMDGEVVIRPKYESIQIVSDKKLLVLDNTTFICTKEGDRGVEILDKNGDVETDLDIREMVYIKDFGFVGGEHNDYYLINEKGEKNSKKSMYDIDLRVCMYVESDYFDTAAATNALVNLFCGDVFTKEGVYIGAAAPKVKPLEAVQLSDISSYTAEYSWDIENNNNYTILGQIHFDAYIKSTNYDYDYYYAHDELNPDAYIDIMGASMTLRKTGYDKQVVEDAVKKLKEKGYSVQISNSNGILLHKDSNLLCLVWKNDKITAIQTANNELYQHLMSEMLQ